MSDDLQEAIARQRKILKDWLSASLIHLAEGCLATWPDRHALEARLQKGWPSCLIASNFIFSTTGPSRSPPTSRSQDYCRSIVVATAAIALIWSKHSRVFHLPYPKPISAAMLSVPHSQLCIESKMAKAYCWVIWVQTSICVSCRQPRPYAGSQEIGCNSKANRPFVPAYSIWNARPAQWTSTSKRYWTCSPS